MKKSTRKLTLEADSELTQLIKSNEIRDVISNLERKYNVKITINKIGICVIKGTKEHSKYILDELEKLKELKRKPTENDLLNILDGKPIEEEIEKTDFRLEFKDGQRNTTILPKTENQKLFINEILNKQVIFGLGSPGTGKSFLSIAVALKMLELKMISKIYISRPNIESGPSIGFLPGSFSEKNDPFLLATFATIDEIIGKEKREKLFEAGKIEAILIGFMRGISIGTKSGIVAIFDEAQNIEFAQHKMILTRLGSHPNSKMIICGDQKQSDLKNKKDTLSKIHEIIKDSKFVGSTVFTKEDIVRSEVVKEILGMIENYEDKNN
jgi:phosphate starvation-inducible PhoH-like protein